MAAELRVDLNRIAIDALQQLVRINVDSADGLEQLATSKSDDADDDVLKAFRQVAAERREFVADLSEFIVWTGNEPRQSGSYAAAIYRIWRSCKLMVSADQEQVLAEELQREEQAIQKAYQQALNDVRGCQVSDLISRQLEAVSSQSAKLSRVMRNSFRDHGDQVQSDFGNHSEGATFASQDALAYRKN